MPKASELLSRRSAEVAARRKRQRQRCSIAEILSFAELIAQNQRRRIRPYLRGPSLREAEPFLR